MPTWRPSRGTSGRISPLLVSWNRISGTSAAYPGAIDRSSAESYAQQWTDERSFCRPIQGLICPELTTRPLQERPMTRVEEGFRTLPERYLGAPAGFDVTYHVRLGDVGHTFEVRCTEHAARVRKGISARPADVVIGTDAETWLRLRAGELSGLEAFRARTLYARGELDQAVRFEGLFRLPDGRDPLMRVHDVELPGRRVSTLTIGDDGPDVLLVHGLGAAKSSFFDCAAYLADSG